MNYHNITKDDMLNGEGLRTTLFVSGCNHHCFNCHNPQTWKYDSGIPFDDETIQEIFDNLSKPYCDGITFSGGDPLSPANIQSVSELIIKIRKAFSNNKTIWVYSGYTYEELTQMGLTSKEWFKLIDVIVDGKFDNDKLDIKLPYRGSSNQNIWDVKKKIIINNKFG